MSVKISTNMRRPHTMDKLVFLVLFICSVYFLQLCGGTAVINNRGYVFTAPKVLLAGETETACLSLHNLEPPVHVLLQLLPPVYARKEEILANTSSVVESGIETCLELMVPPPGAYTAGRLRVKVVAHKHKYEFTSEESVDIQYNTVVTFVETDKRVYKPGQDVHIRILSLRHDLKPWKKIIPKVWITNPSQVRVAQWTNVSTENGMAQLLFPLSSEPSKGTWAIRVEHNELYPSMGHTYNFQVKEYVLPRFQLTIDAPGFILADAKNVTWTICAKYSYGEPVRGTLLLEATMMGRFFTGNDSIINYETKMDPSGCVDFSLNSTSLGLVDFRKAPERVFLLANFTQSGTNVVETAIKKTQVHHVALNLQFEPYMPKYFKPGLPYHGKLRVLDHDNNPAAFKNIEICLKEDNVQCRNFQSGANGFIDFVVQPPQADVMRLNATAVDYPTKYYFRSILWNIMMTQPFKNYEVHSWYSPSNSYLTVARGYQPIECGEKYSFNVMYTVPANEKVQPISFHYSINSKGDLLIYGHVKPKPSRDTILNFLEFNNLLNVDGFPDNVTGAPVVHRFPLSVKITPSMAPVSELLLYYVRPDGEVVATTYKIEVGHCFENKVKTAWHSNVRTPGSTTQYHVEAAPWSLCGVSTVDKSTLFLAGSVNNLIQAGQVFDHLQSSFHPVPDVSPSMQCASISEYSQEEIGYHPPNRPMALQWGRRRSNSLSGEHNYVDATQAFNEFGVIVMSDLKLATVPCPDLRSIRGNAFSFRTHMFMSFPLRGDILATAFPLTLTEMNSANAEKAKHLDKAYVDSLPEQSTTIRSYFPETWLWELVPTGKEGKVTIERTLPHTITDWVGYTACVSPVHGLGIAQPTIITAFQPFFLDYTLPYSVKRGELLRLKVSLFNYMHHSLPVKIILKDAPGLDLQSSSPSAAFCVTQRESVVLEYILKPRIIGEVNITISASIDSMYIGTCGPETLVYTRDVIVKPILIQPEGFPVEVTKSGFVCPKEYSGDSEVVWNLTLPENMVPDSGRAYINLIGDILGPAVENLDGLVKLPVGCGEQNMVLLVPNIHVVKHLDALNVENPTLRMKAIENMEKGYQRELNYRHPDGSYSAFGPRWGSDGSSIWLTAFVLKSFAQARNLITIDDNVFNTSSEWIISKQLKSGCFPVVGTVFHKDMKGGIQYDDSSSTLTAYILIALLESNVSLPTFVIDRALACVVKGMNISSDDPYSTAISAYALALAKYSDRSFMTSLMTIAMHYDNLVWWEHKAKSSLSLSIEMTAYAVLTLVTLGGDENMVHASKAVRWLSKQRNAGGGFTSTQDTVLGLEALTKYAAVVNSNKTDLSILVVAGTMEEHYKMNTDNRLVLKQLPLPVLPTLVEIFTEGEGCLLVQSNLKYNVASVTGSEAFDLAVNAKSVPYASECSVQEVTLCVRYKVPHEESNMALVEIEMISGYVPTKASLHTLLELPSSSVKRYEENHGVVTLYFEKLNGEKTCVSFMVEREVLVDRLEPANVKLYDYYQPELTISKSYNFAPICSSAEPTDVKPTTESTIEVVSVNPQIPPLVSTNLMPLEPVIFHADGLMDVIKEVPISGVQSKVDNVLFVENSNPKINDDDLELVAHVPTTNNNSIIDDDSNTPQIESGSGLTPDSGFPGNPSFVNVDIELEVPGEMEGPVPIYVKPNTFDYEPETTTTTTDEPPNMTPVPEMKGQNISKGESDDRLNSTTNDEQHLSSPTRVKQSCPICDRNLPSDISDVYCSASSAVKVAIRRMRKARLLLDLHVSREIRRLHTTIEFVLPPDCFCAPLDTPETVALIMNKDDDFLASGERKQTLNDSFYIYGLPMVSGEPDNVTKARSVCSDLE